jgi:hypothetical protein
MTELIDQKLRTTWRVNVRDVATSLGIPLSPNQWVVLENTEDDGDSPPIGCYVDIVIWESVKS